MIRILLVEEDLEQKQKAMDYIYEYDTDAIIDWTDNGADAKTLLLNNEYDIMLVHLEAPLIYENKLWLYTKNIPAILFTSTPSIEREIFCFKNGAGDYIARPYIYESVVARGERLLQKGEKIFGDLKLNYRNNNVVLSEKEILLTPTEMKFLFFISRTPEGADFKSIAKNVWGYNEPDMNSMRVLVSKINKKIDGKIENVRNWGYKIKAGN